MGFLNIKKIIRLIIKSSDLLNILIEILENEIKKNEKIYGSYSHDEVIKHLRSNYFYRYFNLIEFVTNKKWEEIEKIIKN